MAKPPPIETHIPTSDELGAYLLEKVAADGTITVPNADGSSLVTARLGVLRLNGTYTLVAVGPGSG